MVDQHTARDRRPKRVPVWPLWLMALLLSVTASAKPKITSPTILFLGDSITAGYGVRRSESYPSLLEVILQRQHPNLRILNGAESGALSSSLLSRLEFYIKRRSDITIVVIAAGGNDARQVTKITEIEKNLEKTIVRAKQLKLHVILAGMQIFKNLGEDYTRDFQAIYPQLAQRHDIILIPFLLSGVAGDPALNLPDGFHPNASGHKKIAEIVAPYVEKLL